jgi:hypothetical protein
VLAFFWLLTLLALWLLQRLTRLRRYVPRKKLPIISILTGTVVYILVFGFSLYGDEYINLGVRHVNTFLWLLSAISGSLLLRVKPEQFRQGFRLYSATFLVMLMIIACRITFVPDKLMVLLFPPILLLIVVWQLCCCIWVSGKATSIDSTLGWVSLAVYLSGWRPCETVLPMCRARTASRCCSAPPGFTTSSVRWPYPPSCSSPCRCVSGCR